MRVANCAEHSGFDSRLDAVEKDTEKQWTAIEKIQNALNYRLPLWATFLIAGQSSVIGYLCAIVKLKGGG